MYFDKLNMWQKMKDAKILYFAPERRLRAKISEQSPLECITADLHPKKENLILVEKPSGIYKKRMEKFDKD
jgi:hypothetical protein